MGLVAKECVLIGLFGGVNIAKSGKTFLSIVSQGPKIDKVQVEKLSAIPPGVEFGSPVVVELSFAEQKFQDFNGSFTTAQVAKVNLQVSNIKTAVNS